MKPHEKTRFDALLAWSQQHGGELHPALEIYCDDVTKFSLRVKPSAADGLQPGFRAVSCPVSTTLSYLNALVDGPLDIASPGSPSPSPQAHNAAFPPRFLQSNPPHVVGRFFLVKEYLRGKASFWWPYIATLPQPEHVDGWALPAFWPDHDIACLAGTNAHVAVGEMQANVRREFKHARNLLKADNVPGWQDYTQLLYKWSFSIFTSRSFRPSLVLSAASQHHAATLLPPTSPPMHLDDFSILQPLLDIANHSPTSRYAWSTTHPPTACTLVPHDPYPAGAQVYNHYGAKTNSELLLAYGFLLVPSAAFHNDYVHVRKRNRPQPNTTNPDSSSSSSTPKEDDDNEKNPKDFLLSLRPLTHASSLVGRARLALNPAAATRLARLPCFVCVEPALVEDLAGAVVASREEAEGVERWNASSSSGEEGEGLLPEAVARVVERVRAVLGGKVEGDLERLRAAAEGLDLDGEEGAGRNRKLARRYREGCERVLEAALEGLMVDVGGQGEEE